MATKSWSWRGYSTAKVNIADTASFTASNTTVSITCPTAQLASWYADDYYISTDKRLASRLHAHVKYGSSNIATITSAWTAYLDRNVFSAYVSVGSFSVNTSTLFSASNKTSKTARCDLYVDPNEGDNMEIKNPTGQDGTNIFSDSAVHLCYLDVTLNAPPTFTVTTTSSGTYYANRSKYTVSVASLSAKYGGTISSAVLSVGSATASRTTNGTLEVTVPSAGTYTPSVKVTDSRGQVTTNNLSAITVVAHTSPTLTATVTSSAPYYNMETDYSASVSDIVTHEGATVSSITLKIGSQTVSRTDAGSLTISTNTAGSFTPTVTILDSFGASTSYSLPAITVNPYVAPTMAFTVQRTLPKTGELTPIGKPDDEGESVVATASISWTSDIAELVAPIVVATDADGNPVSVTSEWYATRASDGTLSDLISDWSTITPSDMPVYGLIGNSTHDAFNTQFSYQIAITPTDDTSAGTAISQTLGSAFYTVDFLAGGHGIAFGQPASNEGFWCAMDMFLRGIRVPTIFISTSAPSASSGENGDIWITY